MATDIPLELREMLKELTKNRKLLKKKLRQAEKSGNDQQASQLTTDLTKLSSAMALLTRELRSWEKKVRESVMSMSNADRIRVIVRFLEELPPGERVMFKQSTQQSTELATLWQTTTGQ